MEGKDEKRTEKMPLPIGVHFLYGSVARFRF
jgi:hypothetical protein